MNNIGKGLQLVEKACNEKGYRFYTVGGDGKNTASSVFINSFEIKVGSNAYDNEDMQMLEDVILNYDMKVLRNVFCDKSMTYTNNGMYVKESYREGRVTLSEVIETAIKGSSYSQNLLESIEDKYISTDFSVNSAFLYKGMYVTPYMAIAILTDILINDIAKEYLKDFYNMYIGIKADKLSKKDYQTISEYLFLQYLQGNNEVIEEVSMHAIQ